MANTVSLAEVAILSVRKAKKTGRQMMLGFEFIGYRLLILLFTTIQYACLLTSASKA
jgi:hypothetical protein